MVTSVKAGTPSVPVSTSKIPTKNEKPENNTEADKDKAAGASSTESGRGSEDSKKPDAGVADDGKKKPDAGIEDGPPSSAADTPPKDKDKPPVTDMVSIGKNGTVWGTVFDTLKASDSTITRSDARVKEATQKVLDDSGLTWDTAKLLKADDKKVNLTSISGGATAADVDAAGKLDKKDRVDVFLIDSFSADAGQTSHGDRVEDILLAGGGDSKLKGKVAVTRFDTGDPDGPDNVQTEAEKTAFTDKIRQGLEKARDQAKADPTSIDAVNISLFNVKDDKQTQEIRDLAKQILGDNVPVAFAAGNRGDTTDNKLIPDGALRVQSTDDKGVVRKESGDGNVRGTARSTSFATPLISTVAGDIRAQALKEGKTLTTQQIIDEINKRAEANGGTLDNPFIFNLTQQ